MNNATNLKFRPDLQGLRAIAILLVVLDHLDIGVITGGFIGVDVFFVLSGYLISGLLFEQLVLNQKINFVAFYARRLKRLLPALLFMIVGSAGLAFSVLSLDELNAQLASMPYALSWTSNIYFAFSEFDYFDELSAKDFYLHTWSLGVEEQFYLLWPLVLLLLFKLGPASKSSFTHRSQWLMLFFMCIGWVLSLYLTYEIPETGFYMVFSRMWQFSLGALVYIFISSCTGKESAIKKSFVQSLLFFLGLAVIILCGSLLDEQRPYPGYWAVLPSLGAALVILSGAFRNAPSILTTKPMRWIGDRSYSWYLWHWPVFVLGFSLGINKSVQGVIALFLISLLASIVSYRLIEVPFWKGRLSQINNRLVILVSLLLIISSVSCSYLVLPENAQSFDKGAEMSRTQQLMQSIRTDLPPIYRMNCDSWFYSAELTPCEFGDDTAEKTVMFAGDSIGAQWFSLIRGVFPASKWKFIVHTKSSCPLVDRDWFYKRIGKVYRVCSDWRDELISEIERIKPDVVILGNTAFIDFSEQDWVDGLATTVGRITQTGSQVYLIPGTPKLGFDGPGCVIRSILPSGQVDRAACKGTKTGIAKTKQVKGYLQQVADRYESVQLIDLNDLVCPEEICYAVSQSGHVIYRDGQHLTDDFVRSLIKPVMSKYPELNQ